MRALITCRPLCEVAPRDWTPARRAIAQPLSAGLAVLGASLSHRPASFTRLSHSLTVVPISL
ncbi:MAG: hypothetical protein AAFO79_03140, partial [Pseudomonadota bacterium]